MRRVSQKPAENTYRSEPLSPRQKDVFEYIQDFTKCNEYPPTRAEIADFFGFKSDNAADEHLRALHKKGWIRLVPAISRGIVVRGASA